MACRDASWFARFGRVRGRGRQVVVLSGNRDNPRLYSGGAAPDDRVGYMCRRRSSPMPFAPGLLFV
jgi:hypothetical protein